MNHKDFLTLKYDIECLMIELQEKQYEYIRQTGRPFVRPIRLKPQCQCNPHNLVYYGCQCQK